MTEHEVALYGADVCGTETRIEELMRLARWDAERRYLERKDALARALGAGKNYRVTDNPRSAEDIHD